MNSNSYSANLNAVDVDVVSELKVPLIRSNIWYVLNIHQHAAQQLVELGGCRQRWRGGAYTSSFASAIRFHGVMVVMNFGSRLHNARHFPQLQKRLVLLLLDRTRCGWRVKDSRRGFRRVTGMWRRSRRTPRTSQIAPMITTATTSTAHYTSR